MFTVRDAENAMVVFIIFALFILVGVFLHESVLKGKSFVDSFYTITDNISKIVSAATLLMIFEEGFDIMLTRFRAARAKDKKLKAEALEAARAEGYAEGYAAAKAETLLQRMTRRNLQRNLQNSGTMTQENCQLLDQPDAAICML